MTAQKFIIKTSYCLTFLLLLSIALNAYQYLNYKRPYVKTDSRSSSNNESTPAKTTPENSGLKTDPGVNREIPYTDKVKELEYQLAAAEEELELANKKLSEEVSEKQGIFKDFMRHTAIQVVNSGYNDLFKRLDIPKEEIDKFRNLLADKSQDLDNIFIKMSGGASTGADVVLEVKKTEDDYARKINEFLGEENYQVYLAYKEREMERGVLSRFMDTVSPLNRIDEKRADALIDAMYEAKQSVENELSPETTIPVERVRRINEKYIEASRTILSPELAEQYKRYLMGIDDMRDSRQR